MKKQMLSLAVGVAMSFGLFAAENSISWDLQKNRNDGARNGAIKLEKLENGLKMTVAKTENFWGGVYFDRQDVIDLNKLNTITVKVIPGEGAAELAGQIGIAVYDKKGGWGVYRPGFAKQEDGRYVSKWTFGKDKLTANYGFNPAIFSRMRLSFPYGKLPDGKTFDCTLVSIESSAAEAPAAETK